MNPKDYVYFSKAKKWQKEKAGDVHRMKIIAKFVLIGTD